VLIEVTKEISGLGFFLDTATVLVKISLMLRGKLLLQREITKIEVTARGKMFYIRCIHQLIKQLNPVLIKIAIHYLNLYD